jgi:hypothetical protein
MLSSVGNHFAAEIPKLHELLTFVFQLSKLSSVDNHFTVEIPKLHELLTFVFQRFHQLVNILQPKYPSYLEQAGGQEHSTPSRRFASGPSRGRTKSRKPEKSDFII